MRSQPSPPNPPLPILGEEGFSRAVDVAIVGGGVAGAALAVPLAEAGLHVIVIERAPRFRDRIRGEAIHPWGVAEASRLGLLSVIETAGGRPLPYWRRYQDRVGGEPYRWADDTPHGECEWTVYHPALQAALLARAAAAGAEILRPAQAVNLIPGTSPTLKIAAGNSEYTISARLVVGADGRRSRVRRWIGGRECRDPLHHKLGGGRFAGIALDESMAHQGFFCGGFAMVFPQGDGKARCYIACLPEAAHQLQRVPTFIERCTTAFPPDAFAAAQAIGPCGFFPCNDMWSDCLTGPGVVLIGDAAGANDPGQGQGLSLVFRDARELSDLLLAETNWQPAIDEFARRRAAYFSVVRAHARWASALLLDQGPAADARRAQVAVAREIDPTAGGYAGIFAFGPDNLPVTDEARRHFFGEDLVG